MSKVRAPNKVSVCRIEKRDTTGDDDDDDNDDDDDDDDDEDDEDDNRIVACGPPRCAKWNYISLSMIIVPWRLLHNVTSFSTTLLL